MPKETRTIVITREEIFEAIKAKYGYDIEEKDVWWDIYESGDVDRGTYNVTVRGLEWEEKL